jgi:hypothetical protein
MQHQHAVVGRYRILMTAEPMQHRTQVEPVADRIGLQCHRALIVRAGFLEPTQLHQRACAVAVGIGEIRRVGNRPLEARQRVLLPADPAQGHAEEILGPRLAAVARQRTLGQLDAFVEPALLAGDHRQVVERRGVIGLALQHLPIAARGIRQRPLAVHAGGLLQQIDGRTCHVG